MEGYGGGLGLVIFSITRMKIALLIFDQFHMQMALIVIADDFIFKCRWR
jgi:hypothetical protein